MLYESGECHPTGKGFTYKLFFHLPNWNIQVFQNNNLIDQKTFHMAFEPRCGVDITDANIIDNFIEQIIKSTFLKKIFKN